MSIEDFDDLDADSGEYDLDSDPNVQSWGMWQVLSLASGDAGAYCSQYQKPIVCPDTHQTSCACASPDPFPLTTCVKDLLAVIRTNQGYANLLAHLEVNGQQDAVEVADREGVLTLIDGHHRVAALEQSNFGQVYVRIGADQVLTQYR